MYFDDLVITHTSANAVLQADDYYPFGLPMENNGFLEAGVKANRFLYQGKEWQTELGLNLYDFHARQFDPSLGRWLASDPQNQFASPYLGMGNIPTYGVDPDGEFLIPALIGAAVGILTNGVSNVINHQSFFKGAGMAALVGGIGGAASFGIGEFSEGLKGLGKLGAQTASHSLLGGGMSALSGGDFGAGALSGAFGSLVGAGSGSLLKNTRSNFLKAAGTIGSGALAGGIGSEIGGGDFWDGVRNGIISSGLNEAVHSGVLGEYLTMAALTGRTRYLFGPDAQQLGVTGDLAFLGEWPLKKPLFL